MAGFRTWQSLGRQVRKGERGLAILAPCAYRRKAANRAEPAAPAGQQPATTCSGGVAPQGSDGQQVRGFRVVHVFDLLSTDGAPLPDVAPTLLVGQAPAGLWDALAKQITAHGYTAVTPAGPTAGPHQPHGPGQWRRGRRPSGQDAHPRPIDRTNAPLRPFLAGSCAEDSPSVLAVPVEEDESAGVRPVLTEPPDPPWFMRLPAPPRRRCRPSGGAQPVAATTPSPEASSYQ